MKKIEQFIVSNNLYMAKAKATYNHDAGVLWQYEISSMKWLELKTKQPCYFYLSDFSLEYLWSGPIE